LKRGEDRKSVEERGKKRKRYAALTGEKDRKEVWTSRVLHRNKFPNFHQKGEEGIRKLLRKGGGFQMAVEKKGVKERDSTGGERGT